MKIAEFNRQTVNDFHAEALKAVKEVAAKYGVTVNDKGGRFSSTTFTQRFEFCVVSESGSVRSPGRIALETFYPQYVDKEITLYGGEIGTVIEFHSRKRKYPFIVETKNGKQYKVTEHQVMR